MIIVDQLAKSYGAAHALRGVSFEVARGEVLGFLGPNGAGKSTTMKILTGFLLPTSGGATMDGLDVVTDSLAVRRRLGYLPESTPLYAEMRVDEYLKFAAEIRGVGVRQCKAAVARVVDLCGLARVTGKNILELSKGYKQRVGLAQAMIHEPEVLILDEPTSGLDPNQIVEVRDLIDRIGQEHTVILSTHYLQEIEKSADRIIIIHLGRIVANDSLPALTASVDAGALVATIRGPEVAVRAQLESAFPKRTMTVATRDGDVLTWRIDVGQRERGMAEEATANLVAKNGWGLFELRREAAALEDVFRDRTVGVGHSVVEQSRDEQLEEAASAASEQADGSSNA